MIIYLDDLSWLDATNRSHSTAVSNILRASSEGAHYVIATTRAIQMLEASSILGDREAGELKRLFNDKAYRLTVIAKCPKRVDLVRDSIAPRFDADTNAFLLPSSSFASIFDLAPTKMLVENTVDSCIYSELIRSHIKSKYRGSINFAYDVRHGGGSTTYQQLDLILQDSPIGLVVAIADSDKACPNCSLGDTAADIERVARRYAGCGKAFMCIVLDVHEVENLIPASAEHAFSQRTRLSFNHLQIFLSHANAAGFEAWRYVDVKKGKRFDTHRASPECCRSYWDRLVRQVPFAVDMCNRCLEAGCCRRSRRGECTCWVYKKTKKEVLKDIKGLLDKMSTEEKVSLFEHDSMTDRISYGRSFAESIAEFFFASRRQRA